MRHTAIGLCYTLKCPLACRHCITESSPAAAGKMTVEQARGYIDVIPRFTNALCFTGGEPLIYHREIVALTRHAAGLGLHVGLVTGAGWARNEGDAKRRIEALAGAGLRQLTISWDVYHEEFSPADRAERVARLAAAAGLAVTARTVTPAHCGRPVLRNELAALPLHVESSPVIRLGRAASLPHENFHQYREPPRSACDVVMSTTIAHDGRVYACCGPGFSSTAGSPLVLGRAGDEPLDVILERATRDPVLEVISLLGPYGLYVLLRRTTLGDAYVPRTHYASICDLCMDLTNAPAIVAAIRERLKEHPAQVLVAAARLWHERRGRPEPAPRRARAS